MFYNKILVVLCLGCCLFGASGFAAETLEPEVTQPSDTIVTPIETPPVVEAAPNDLSNTLPSQCKKLAEIYIRADRKPVSQAVAPAAGRPTAQSPIRKEAIVRIYESMNNTPLWTKDGIITPQAKILIEYLVQSGAKALPTSAYIGSVDWATYLQGASEDTDRVCRDLALSVAGMRYISHVRMGLVNPRSLGMRLDLSPKLLNLAEFMLKLATSDQPGQLLTSLEPSLYPYRVLVQTYKLYHGLLDDKQMQVKLTVPRRSIRPGQGYKDLARLIYRLERLGVLPKAQTAAPIPKVYSKELSNAVKLFQKRNGLKADGRLTADTVNTLNMPIKQLMPRLAVAIERWRWMPEQLGHRPIIVNIPEYKLYALESDGSGWYKTAFTMNVIVGKNDEKYRTPRVHSAIDYIEFTPYWNVPISILQGELHKSIQIRGYLAKHNYEIVRESGPNAKPLAVNSGTLAKLWNGKLLLRQKPGGKNALGEAKFVFQNDFSVYLHGTPNKGLFSRKQRALSHGCIRLATPALLATHLLQDTKGWDQKQVDATIAAKKNDYVRLKHPTAIYLIYDTTVVDADGTIRPVPDVYMQDPILLQALEKAQKIVPPI